MTIFYCSSYFTVFKRNFNSIHFVVIVQYNCGNLHSIYELRMYCVQVYRVRCSGYRPSRAKKDASLNVQAAYITKKPNTAIFQ